jgi:hypothetical protein
VDALILLGKVGRGVIWTNGRSERKFRILVPLAEAATALERVVDGSSRGSIVLTMA